MDKKTTLITTFLVSFCSICYELMLADTLALMTHKHVLWQSLTIGIFIASMGCGTYLTTTFDKKDYENELLKVEYYLSLVGAISILLLFFFRTVYNVVDTMQFIDASSDEIFQSWNFYTSSVFILFTQSLTFILGYLTGREIPLLIQIGQKNNKDITNTILGVNYLGTLAGTLILVFFLHPVFDIINTGLLISFFNFLLFLFLHVKLKKQTLPWKRVISFITVVIILMSSSNFIHQSYLKIKFYYFDYASRSTSFASFLHFLGEMYEAPKVERKKSLYQYIDRYMIDDLNNGTNGIQLSLDEEFQFSFSTEKEYHEAMAHIPIMVNNKIPKNILILGGGDGLLTRELLYYPETKITQVELDEDMVKTCLEDPRISSINEKSMADPRVTMKYMDGFWYLRNTKEKYDAIWIDFPYPRSFNIIKLYSTEFYKYAQRVLNPDGFLLIGLPIESLNSGFEFSKRDKIKNDIYFSTLVYSGFKHFVPFSVDVHSFLMASMIEKTNKNLKNLMSRPFAELTDDQLDIFSKKYPHDIKEDLVNSIFRPILIKYVD